MESVLSSWEPDESFWSGISNTVGGWADSISSNVSGFVDTAFNSVSTAISGAFDSLSGIVTGIPDAIGGLFTPEEQDMTANKQKLDNALSSKFGFLSQFQTAMNNLNVAGEPFSIPISWGEWEGEISLDWYEPHRVRIRSGVSTMFYLLTFLAIFKMLSSVFNIHSGSGSSAAIHSLGNYMNRGKSK